METGVLCPRPVKCHRVGVLLLVVVVVVVVVVVQFKVAVEPATATTFLSADTKLCFAKTK